MSKIDRKKTTWTVSPTRKKVIILILSVNTELGLQSRWMEGWRWREEGGFNVFAGGKKKLGENKKRHTTIEGNMVKLYSPTLHSG